MGAVLFGVEEVLRLSEELDEQMGGVSDLLREADRAPSGHRLQRPPGKILALGGAGRALGDGHASINRRLRGPGKGTRWNVHQQLLGRKDRGMTSVQRLWSEALCTDSMRRSP